MNQEDNAKFLHFYSQAFESAQRVVKEHSEDGENEIFSIPQMYPNGGSDILFMMFHKVTRALGYNRAGNYSKVLEEVLDILNYAAFYFALTMFKLEQKK